MSDGLPRGRTLATTCAALLFLAAAAGCGSKSTDSSGGTEPSSSPSSAGSASTSAGASASSPDSSASPITDAQVAAALLTVDDLTGFTGWVVNPAPNSDSAGPCDPTGTPPVSQRVPAEATASVEMDHQGDGSVILQDVNAYADDGQAAQAFALFVAGLGCTDGTLSDGTPITIGKGSDVTSQVNTDGLGRSTAWQFTGKGFEGVAVATLSHGIATDLVVIKPTGGSTADIPNPISLAQAAFQKILRS
jgi:hypothetical protein